MRKSFLLGLSVAMVMLVGAGCSQTTPKGPGSEAPSETEAAAPAPEAAAANVSATKTDEAATDGAPLQLTMLGLNEDKDAVRFRAKVTALKDIKKAFISYTCVYDEGKDPETFNSAWNNENNQGESQPIVAGKTYESQIKFARWAVSCSELKLTNVNFADGSEW